MKSNTYFKFKLLEKYYLCFGICTVKIKNVCQDLKIIKLKNISIKIVKQIMYHIFINNAVF